MYGKAIGDAIAGMFIVIAVAAFGFGALLTWGLPKLWALVKPWLHAVTG